MRASLLLVVLAVALVLTLAVPAFATHIPGGTGCAQAHECGDQYAEYLPGGVYTPFIYAYNPISGSYQTMGVLGPVALCHNYGGYYYLTDDGGEYWNAC